MKENNPDLMAAFPKVYYSGGRHVDEDEDIHSKGFLLLVMEDVSDRLAQSASMNRAQAVTLMEALATLHAHYWDSEKVNGMERGSFWVLERRKHRGGEAIYKHT